MTGAEFAAAREHLGYTQAALAKALGTSAPTVSRWESAAQVPAEKVQALHALPPAPEAARGPYRRATASPAPRRAAPAVQARNHVSEARRPPSTRPPPLPAPPPAVHVVEEGPVLLDSSEAVLLEGSELRWYWERVTMAKILMQERIRRRWRR